MQHGPLTYISTRELTGLPNNPRTITQAQLNRLCDSIRCNGFWEHRPLGVERQGDRLVVLDGNQRLKAARRLKMSATEAIAFKMVEKALSGDSKAASFCMQLQANDRLQKKYK